MAKLRKDGIATRKESRTPGAVVPTGYSLKLALRSVMPGWHPLLRRIFEAKPKDVHVIQVKEKWGRLVVYINTYYNGDKLTPFAMLVLKAEAESAKICASCGKPGRVCRPLCASCAISSAISDEP